MISEEASLVWGHLMMSQEPSMDQNLEAVQYQDLEERTAQLEEHIKLIEARLQALENSVPERYP